MAEVIVYGIPRNKLTTIYNPCDYNLLQTKAADNPIQLKTGNAIITMGRLTDQKGQWHLIRAINRVKQSIPDVKLYILGEGPLEKPLKGIISDLHLEDNVKMLGYIEAPHACFKYCDAFVFPSEFEGLGNVLLEAMAFGLPCISTDCYSGPREILNPGTTVKEHLDSIEFGEYGILTSVCGKGNFDASSPLTIAEEQLADAIKEILLNSELKDHYHNRSLERKEAFSPKQITNEWLSILE